jgi:hypothetical protein
VQVVVSQLGYPSATFSLLNEEINQAKKQKEFRHVLAGLNLQTSI